ncbi:lytic transglycosylase domain-containing protein [Saccharopolyspora sp. NPDC049426]|uniref:lytic transglycosylase domain-containing protein n=1 Tax=Saccharopolyspora sp. NPDC049426 TaxID=3155652 RepID=UPI003429A246
MRGHAKRREARGSRGRWGRNRAGYPALAIASLLLAGADHAQWLETADTTAAASKQASVSRSSDSSRRASPSPPASAFGVGFTPGQADALVGDGLLSRSTQYLGIPATMLDSYRRAAEIVGRSNPDCHVSWPLLAAIGKVESGHARGGNVDASGTARRPILGPTLDGTNGTAAILNKVGSKWRQSGQWARAAGPMQFIPSTWTRWGADANDDGQADPHNAYDASLAAARYVCAGGRDLRTSDGLQDAILSYNHSMQYVQLVLHWMRAFEAGGLPVPDSLGSRGFVTGTDSESQQAGVGRSTPGRPSNSSPDGPPPEQGVHSSNPPAGTSEPAMPPPSPPRRGIVPGPVGDLLPAPVGAQEPPVLILAPNQLTPP